MQIGSQLLEECKESLIHFMKEHIHVFAFSKKDLIEVSPKVAEHWLNMDLGKRLVKYKLRSFSAQKVEIMRTEVDKLLKVGQIREIQFSEWVANVVIVP